MLSCIGNSSWDIWLTMKLSLFPLLTLAWEAFFSNAIWDWPITELDIGILGWNWDSITEKKLAPTPLENFWGGWG